MIYSTFILDLATRLRLSWILLAGACRRLVNVNALFYNQIVTHLRYIECFIFRFVVEENNSNTRLSLTMDVIAILH